MSERTSDHDQCGYRVSQQRVTATRDNCVREDEEFDVSTVAMDRGQGPLFHKIGFLK